MSRLAVLCIIALAITAPLLAQSADGPVPIAPGQPLAAGVAGPDHQPDGCYPPLGLMVDEQVGLVPGVHFRSGPSLSHPMLGYVTEALIVTVRDGPVCDGGSNWWQLEGSDVAGWVSEGQPGRYFLLAVAPAASDTCQSAYDNAIGQPATLTLNVRMRAQPDTDAVTLTVVPAGSAVTITDGPQCQRGRLWWQVRARVLGQVYAGWMAEGDGGRTWLVPDDAPSAATGTLCAPPLDFSAGDRGYVTYADELRARYLRDAPGLNGAARYRLLRELPFVVIGGPVCADNLNWWQIETLGGDRATGWLAEGSPVGYWMRPLSLPLHFGE